MINILEKTEPEVTKVMKKGNALLQMVDSPEEEPALREKMADVSREMSDVKKKLEEKEAFLEKVLEKTVEFEEITEQLETWITTTAKEPVLTERVKTANPVAVAKRLQQLEVSVQILHLQRLSFSHILNQSSKNCIYYFATNNGIYKVIALHVKVRGGIESE